MSGIDTQIVYHKDESDNLLNQARELQAKADSSKSLIFPSSHHTATFDKCRLISLESSHKTADLVFQRRLWLKNPFHVENYMETYM